ncbi:MAG: phosphomannomutase/phosphoglucomutase, partial [Bdellovibrionota bacterium]
MNSSIFREYDIRGVAGKDLSAELATNLGKAYAHLARERLGKQELRVSVGRDVRLTGEEYSAALIKGLRAAGVNVISLGQVTTPMTYFSIHHLKLDGAIMVTGSHNPPEYNGFKICIGKGTLHGSEIQELRKIMEKNVPAGAIREGSSEHLNIFPAYLDFILKDVKLKRPLKIVVDAGNGAASNFAPEIFRKLGCDVTELFCTPDGRFPNHPADPTVESNRQDVIAAVTETGADAGIAFDGDADRIGVVNEKGGILWGEELM